MTRGRDWQGENLAGWLLSEKLDGCRAYWDGSTLWTRGGNEIPAPASFLAALPAGQPLDGEIYAGRGHLETARLAVQFGHWTPALRFVAFDSPATPGTWPARLAAARRVYGDCVIATPCRSNDHARELIEAIQAAGGEGLVARSPYVTGYERGKTGNVLKIKSPPLA